MHVSANTAQMGPDAASTRCGCVPKALQLLDNAAQHLMEGVKEENGMPSTWLLPGADGHTIEPQV